MGARVLVLELYDGMVVDGGGDDGAVVPGMRG